jgi:hypothetical protein
LPLTIALSGSSSKDFFDLFMLMLNAKLEHSPLIDPDDVEESVLVKNAT